MPLCFQWASTCFKQKRVQQLCKVINLLYYEYWTDKQKYLYVYARLFSLIKEKLVSSNRERKIQLLTLVPYDESKRHATFLGFQSMQFIRPGNFEQREEF